MNQDPSPPESTTPAAPDTDLFLTAVRVLFTRNPTLGTPAAPTQAGFLVLARAGKYFWNAWRKAYPGPMSNFSGVDFRGVAAINFSGFSFGDAVFDGAQLGDWARFEDAQFGDWAGFTGAQFGHVASFISAKFGNLASFDGAQFGEKANFEGAQFGDWARFDGAQFGDFARFDGAQFGNLATFNGAQFGESTKFDGAQFGKLAEFAAWDVARIQEFWKEWMSEESAQQRVNFAGAQGLRSDAFHNISFRGVQFAGNVSFQGRIFLSETDFGPTINEMIVKTPGGERVIPEGQPTRFKGIPNFHGCTLHQNTSFDHADFLAPPSADAARAYRTLKLAFAQQHAIREEQKFFRLEMQAETGIATGNKKRLYQLYEKMSDYGFSLKRPIKYWLYSLAGFALAYGLLTGTYGWNGNISWERTMQWVHYALLSAVPLPGFDKTLDVLRSDLFSKETAIQFLVTILEIFHKTVSFLAFFLIGLALRNLFKMKG